VKNKLVVVAENSEKSDIDLWKKRKECNNKMVRIKCNNDKSKILKRIVE
jgi:hypothetical protein